MAAVVNEDGNLRRQDMEGAVSATTTIGAGPGANTFVEAIYQGIQTWGRKANSANALRGFFCTITTIDMTAAGDEVVMWKASLVNSAAIDVLGMRARIGSAVTAYYEYIIHDDGTLGAGEFLYPVKDAWIIQPIDPNVVAWRDSVTGTPSLTAVTEIALSAAVNVTTVNENIIFDAIDINDGLYLTRGDSTDADGVFEDFVVDDFGTPTAGRFGNYSTRDGIIFAFGKTVIGRTVGGSTANATEFTDSLRTLVFPGGYVDAGWNEIEFDMTNANTLVTLNNVGVEGRGRNNKQHYFDTELEVNGGTEVITFTDGHDFATGDLCVYSNEGGTNLGGLTTGTSYFVNRLGATTIAVYAVGATVGRANSFADTSRVDLTAATAGNGENHSFRRTPDTRPDITFTGAGASAVGLLDGCVLTACRIITLTSVADIDNSTLTNCFSIVIGTGNMDGNAINAFILALGEAAITASTLVGIDNNIFTRHADGGHAVEIDTAGTFGYLGNTHTGYGPGTASSAGVHDNEFDTITDVDDAAETITLGVDTFVTGDPVYYNDEGGTDTIGLTDGNLYYVRRTAAFTFSIHESKFSADNNSNPIGLTDGSSGETHTLYSANAAVHNSSGGLVTVQVSSGGDTPSIRNSGANSTTNVENNVALTFSGLRDNTEVRVYTAGTTTELAGVENATDGGSDDRSVTFSLAASISVDVRFAHGVAADGNVYRVPDRNSILALTWPTTTTTIPITQVLDRAFDNPA